MAGNRFSRYAWFVTLFNMGVIVWGAVVRATGSGAGCGNHWPTCDGNDIIPNIKQIETLVEFVHRATSGLAGVLVLVLLVWAFRRRGVAFTRVAAVFSFIFILIEGGLGALLVKLELTASNASALRAMMVAIHLCNTLFLLAFLSLTAWSGARSSEVGIRWEASPGLTLFLITGLVGTLILAAAGAVTALGDTLFPNGSLAEGIAADVDANSHFLIRLRVIHPVIAIVVSGYLLLLGRAILTRLNKPAVMQWYTVLFWIILMQVGLGVINVASLAPLVIQLAHLLLADMLWIVMVILTVEAISEPGTFTVTDQAAVPLSGSAD